MAFQDDVTLEEEVASVACQADQVEEGEVNHEVFHPFLQVPMMTRALGVHQRTVGEVCRLAIMDFARQEAFLQH